MTVIPESRRWLVGDSEARKANLKARRRILEQELYSHDSPYCARECVCM